MDSCAAKNRLLIELDKTYSNKSIRFLRKLPIYIELGFSMLKLYSIKPIESQKINNAMK